MAALQVRGPLRSGDVPATRWRRSRRETLGECPAKDGDDMLERFIVLTPGERELPHLKPRMTRQPWVAILGSQRPGHPEGSSEGSSGGSSGGSSREGRSDL